MPNIKNDIFLSYGPPLLSGVLLFIPPDVISHRCKRDLCLISWSTGLTTSYSKAPITLQPHCSLAEQQMGFDLDLAVLNVKVSQPCLCRANAKRAQAFEELTRLNLQWNTTAIPHCCLHSMNRNGMFYSARPALKRGCGKPEHQPAATMTSDSRTIDAWLPVWKITLSVPFPRFSCHNVSWWINELYDHKHTEPPND